MLVSGEVSKTRSFIPLDFQRRVWSAPNRILMLHRPPPTFALPHLEPELSYLFLLLRKKKNCLGVETYDSPPELLFMEANEIEVHYLVFLIYNLFIIVND